MTYAHVLKNLNGRGFFQIKPGLERMQRIAVALSHPEKKWAALHIAGTNGKGSVSATLDTILRSAGFKTGLYTSPHLISLNERIRINGKPIPSARFTACGQRLIAEEKKLGFHLTYFEFVTALAFLYFAEEKVDVAVIECGMGGKWDATNILPRPAVAVITSIGLDHTAWLGNTLTAISHEKAGIIKRDGVTICGAQPSVQHVFRERARQENNSIFVLGHDFRGLPLRADWQKSLQSWRYQAPHAPPRVLTTPLMGRHQVDNGAIIMNVVECLKAQGWLIKDAAVEQGFKTVYWPGRLQLVRHKGRPLLMIDGAHNPHAMGKLIAALREPFFAKRRNVFVFSAFADKDVAGMAELIGPIAERIYLCEMRGTRRASLAELDRAFARYSARVIASHETIGETLTRALRQARPADVVIATGSLMLVGDALKIL